MAVNPFYNPKFRALDANADPLAGGLLYTYAAGTSTPLATYTTRAGSVANANPVVLDANGEADVWTTPGVDYKFELRNSAGVVQWTVDNVPSPAEEDSTGNVTTEPGGRLTLTSATPVTTSDVTGATSVYYVPQNHNKVPLYDGSSWSEHSIATELSQTTADNTKSPAAVANNSPYDMFIWNDSGTLRLSRGPAWSSDTARGTGAGTTELEQVDGRYVNKVSISNGPAAQCGLYVGTVRSDGSAQINDSRAKRHVWNLYNRELRHMLVSMISGPWSYSSATLRQANGNASHQLDVVVGLSLSAIEVRVEARGSISLGGGAPGSADGSVNVGVDSTTAPSAIGNGPGRISQWGSGHVPLATFWALYRGFPGIGRHYFAWLENGDGTTSITWSTGQIHGTILG